MTFLTLAKILEAGMLICFGISWPISIRKSLKLKFVRGKSLGFLGMVFVGYLFGMGAKYLRAVHLGQPPELVTLLYGLNACLVATEIFLYFRYRHNPCPVLDRKAEARDSAGLRSEISDGHWGLDRAPGPRERRG